MCSLLDIMEEISLKNGNLLLKYYIQYSIINSDLKDMFPEMFEAPVIF